MINLHFVCPVKFNDSTFIHKNKFKKHEGFFLKIYQYQLGILIYQKRYQKELKMNSLELLNMNVQIFIDIISVLLLTVQ